jgi:hypothetical protein
MLVASARRGWLWGLAREFSKKVPVTKPTKEKNYGIAYSDEKMIKLTTKEDSKAAEALRVGFG